MPSKYAYTCGKKEPRSSRTHQRAGQGICTTQAKQEIRDAFRKWAARNGVTGSTGITSIVSL